MKEAAYARNRQREENCKKYRERDVQPSNGGRKLLYALYGNEGNQIQKRRKSLLWAQTEGITRTGLSLKQEMWSPSRATG